jgi:threonylcarbamoyladenosine tRNA methylthiotransferase MtaB
MRVRLESVGCRLNISEMESLARQVAAAGHRVVGPSETADLLVFNTCTVTATASRKSRHILRQLKRANPNASVVATGCYAEMEPDRLEALGLDLIVPNADKDHLAGILRERGLLPDPTEPVTEPPPFLEGSRIRAFLKVQDGCDNRCTFCIVTVARGAGASRTPDSVIQEVRELESAGYREAVLSGVHLGSYGHDQGDRHGLFRLVRRLLRETSIPRLRLSSLEPWDLDDAFFDLFDDPRLLPHLHLPLQSGCDATLQRMARRTTQAEFASLVEAARRRNPDMAISSDIIVGFPGETEDEFNQSLEFVEAMAFSRLHIFRYSARLGTRAATMPHQVPGPVAAERSRRMHELGAAQEAAFAGRFVGRTVPVLWEAPEDFGDTRRWSGLTDYYVRVATEAPATIDLTNRVTPTRIAATLPGGLLGEVAGVSIPNLIEPQSNRLPVL